MAAEPAVSRAAESPVRALPDERATGRSVAVGIAVFASGAVLLGVEIAASRVLAPFFGSSLFVWGSLIGVVLTGLAIGYWVGGGLADRIPVPALLPATMGVGAALVLAIPFADDPVLEAVVRLDLGARSNPLLASIALFGPPSVVFAAVTPIAVRLRSRSVASAGATAGRLFALSTAGSIAGTFATAFFLVPELGTNQLLALGAATLFVAAALVAVVERQLVGVALGTLAAVAAVAASVSFAVDDGRTRLSGVAARNWSPVYRDRSFAEPRTDFAAEGLKVVFSKDTRYHRLAVLDDADMRYLRFESSFQSGMLLGRPFATAFTYTDYFALPLAYHPTARDMLFVGLGGGSALKRLWRDFPRLRLQAVELDPVVRAVAYRYFALPRDPRLRVDVEDGRRYLADHERRWDVIALDAYFADSIPFHLTTREFLELVRSRLAPGGVVVANVIGSIRGPGSRLFRAFYRTYRAVFPTVVVHPVLERGDRDLDQIRNQIVVASDVPAPRKAFLADRWRRLRAASPRAPDLKRAIADRYDGVVRTSDVPLLTDDYAPTDALLLFDG